MKKKTLAKLVDDVSVLLQKLVRLKAAKAADQGGYVECVDGCGGWEHYKKMDGGHYFSRKDAGTKILEENIHPQMKGCNLKMGHGDTKITEGYRRYMIEMYGEIGLAEMERQARAPKKHDRADLEELKSGYRRQIRELEYEL